MLRWQTVCGLMFCWALSALAGTGPTVTAARAADDGEKVFKETCPTCHNAQTRPLDNIRHTREEWTELIEKMMGLGADIPKKSIPQLLDYLVRTHGPSAEAPAPAATSGTGAK